MSEPKLLAVVKARRVAGSMVVTVPRRAVEALRLVEGELMRLYVGTKGTPRLVYEKQGGRR